MSTFAAPQQSDWNTNIYNLTITRILIVFGVTYLIRSIVSYFFQTVPAATRAPSTDVENIALENVDLTADTLSISSPSPNISTDVNVDLEPDIQQPQRSYNPRDHPQRSCANSRRAPQASAVFSSTNVRIGSLTQDAIAGNSTTPKDEVIQDVFAA